MEHSKDEALGIADVLQNVSDHLDEDLVRLGPDTEIIELPLLSEQWAIWDDVADIIRARPCSPEEVGEQLRLGLRAANPESRFRHTRLLFWLPRQFSNAVGEEWLAPHVAKRIMKENESPHTRCYLIRFAGAVELDPPRLIPAIEKLLTDKSELVRCSAILALAEYGLEGEQCWPIILSQLRKESSVDVWNSFERLVYEALASACQDLELDGEEERDGLPNEAIISLLIAKATSADAEVKRIVIQILGSFGELAAPATGVLSEALHDGDVDMAYRAAVALGAIGPKARHAVPALIKARHRELIEWVADDALANIDPEKHATLKLQEAMAGEEGSTKQGCDTALFERPNKVKIADAAPIVLEDIEAAVIQALIELGAGNQLQLADRSGVNQPGRILKRIVDKHPQLGRYIILPGRKGHGGYRTTIEMKS